MRLSLSSTAAFTAAKLAFTSSAEEAVPAVNVWGTVTLLAHAPIAMVTKAVAQSAMERRTLFMFDLLPLLPSAFAPAGRAPDAAIVAVVVIVRGNRPARRHREQDDG